ncbi:hypothetical protein [Streptomyces lydicus]|nr:hypothetical protein [Streptomyces lydicus]
MSAPMFGHQRQVYRRSHRSVRTQQRVGQLEQLVPAGGQAVEEVVPEA